MAKSTCLADLTVQARYEVRPEALFEQARSFADLIEVTRRISSYHGLPAVEMQAGKTYKTDIKVFGLFNCRNYEIHVSALCPETRRIDTSEAGGGVKSWRHTLEILPDGAGSIWIDRVMIDAGALTPLIARYARFMYRHRHTARRATTISTALHRPSLPIGRELDLHGKVASTN